MRDFALLFVDSGIELSVPADHGVDIDVDPLIGTGVRDRDAVDRCRRNPNVVTEICFDVLVTVRRRRQRHSQSHRGIDAVGTVDIVLAGNRKTATGGIVI